MNSEQNKKPKTNGCVTDGIGIGCVLLISLAIIVPLFIDQISPQAWRSDLKQAIEFEQSSDLENAISYYKKVEFTPDQIDMWTIDFEARCHFLLGNVDQSIHLYNTLYQSRFSEIYFKYKESDPAYKAMQLQLEEQWEESIAYCDKIIELNERISVNWSPMNPIEHREYYYDLSSEGYIRKYVALLNLDKTEEAETLFENYKVKYKSDMENSKIQ